LGVKISMHCFENKSIHLLQQFNKSIINIKLSYTMMLLKPMSSIFIGENPPQKTIFSFAVVRASIWTTLLTIRRTYNLIHFLSVLSFHTFHHENYVPVSIKLSWVKVDETNQILQGNVAFVRKIQFLERKILLAQPLCWEFMEQFLLKVRKRLVN
jgi:hypothetical protein